MLTQPFWEVWSTLHCGRQLLLRWSAAGSRKPKITKRQSKKFAKVVENAKDPPKLPCFCKRRVWRLVNFCSGWSSHSPSDWTGLPGFLFVKNKHFGKIMNILHIMIMRHTMCHVVIYHVMIYLEHLFLLCFLVRRNCHRFSHLARLSSLFMHHLTS